MKRRLKWTLILLGVPALALGLLAVDSRRRALHAIEQQEARLQADVAKLRARRHCSTLLDGRDLSGLDRLPCPSDSFSQKGVLEVGYEQGHTGQDAIKALRTGEMTSVAIRAGRHVTPLRPDELLTVFAVTERCFSEAGFDAYNARRFYDTRTLDALGQVLVQPGVGVEELQRVRAALDELLATRPPLEDVFEGENLLDREEVLRVFHTKSDNHAMMLQSPGAAEGFSWRVLVVKALHQLDDRRFELFEAKSASLEDWGKKAREIGIRAQHEGCYTRSNLATGAASIIEAERLALCHWRFAQVATAIALFQAEKRREPASVQELVPEYFAELPVNPYGGKPFDYRDGTLRTMASSGPQFSWPLRRK
ncbi:MAG TPA: hypothetical protein VNM14_07835 [Planctomycetota bacterium]|jgi:hypothetical protein|nr:hypothetical protein [Planctomycetota bacterium]